MCESRRLLQPVGIADLEIGLPLRTVQRLLPCVLAATPRVQPCEDLVATLRWEVVRLEEKVDEIRCRRGRIAEILVHRGTNPAVQAATE